jgi:hypothetical protein
MSGTRHRPKKGNCDYGNSVIGGLRRLDKAAQRGDPKAGLMEGHLKLDIVRLRQMHVYQMLAEAKPEAAAA